MNEPTDAFDWSSLGEEPLPGEQDDDALLAAVLEQVDAPPAPVPAERPWLRPAIAAVLLVAAAVVLVLVAPRWRDAVSADDADGAVAPDVKIEPDPDTVQRQPVVEPPAPRPTPPTSEAATRVEPEPAPTTEPEPTTQTPRPRRVVPPPSADALLREAQDAFAAKDTAGARRKYGALLRHHPRSAEARAARVSLGRLELAAGRAKRALTHFERYLGTSGGSLRREAALGRIDALRELGRTGAERDAIETFLDRHPKTVHGQRLRSRLEALR